MIKETMNDWIINPSVSPKLDIQQGLTLFHYYLRLFWREGLQSLTYGSRFLSGQSLVEIGRTTAEHSWEILKP